MWRHLAFPLSRNERGTDRKWYMDRKTSVVTVFLEVHHTFCQHLLHLSYSLQFCVNGWGLHALLDSSIFTSVWIHWLLCCTCIIRTPLCDLCLVYFSVISQFEQSGLFFLKYCSKYILEVFQWYYRDILISSHPQCLFKFFIRRAMPSSLLNFLRLKSLP